MSTKLTVAINAQSTGIQICSFDELGNFSQETIASAAGYCLHAHALYAFNKVIAEGAKAGVAEFTIVVNKNTFVNVCKIKKAIATNVSAEAVAKQAYTDNNGKVYDWYTALEQQQLYDQMVSLYNNMAAISSKIEIKPSNNLFTWEITESKAPLQEGDTIVVNPGGVNTELGVVINALKKTKVSKTYKVTELKSGLAVIRTVKGTRDNGLTFIDVSVEEAVGDYSIKFYDGSSTLETVNLARLWRATRVLSNGFKVA